TPMAMASSTAKTPASIETRAPQTTREKQSRPRSSVPNGWLHVGAFRIWPQSVLTGSLVAIHGAKIATPRNPSTTRPPTTASGRPPPRRQCRPRFRTRAGAVASTRRPAAAPTDPSAATGVSPDPDAWVQERVRQVDQEIDPDVGAGRDQHHALHQGVVAGE